MTSYSSINDRAMATPIVSATDTSEFELQSSIKALEATLKVKLSEIAAQMSNGYGSVTPQLAEVQVLQISLQDKTKRLAALSVKSGATPQ